MSKSISYIISAYNEGEIIKDTIEYCIKYFTNNFYDYELILINDGSKDNTGIIMDDFAKTNNKIIVLHNLINLNMGISIQRAMSIASKELVLYNAADLPLDPVNTQELINLMNDGTDVLILQRKKYLGTSIWRRFSSFVNRMIVFLLFPKEKFGIRDTNYTQMFRKEIIKSILPISRGPIFTWPEMIFRAKRLKYKIKIHDVDYNPKHLRKGAFGKPHDILWGIYEMLRFRLVGR